MADTPFVYWVGDMIQIDPAACRIDGSSLDPKLKGKNFNWYVTEVDPAESMLILGAYSSFGLRFEWSPAIRIDEKFAQIVKLVCRHSETVIDPAKDPTCTETGATEGKHCKTCGTVLVPQQVIEPLQHEFEYDVETGIRVCTRCKYQESDFDKVIDFTGQDIRKLIKIIEDMLSYNSSAVYPPYVEPTATPPDDPVFGDNITFTDEWCTDSTMPYLAYTPSTATTDGTTPLIVWLHGSGEVSSSESVFRNAGLPAVMKTWNLQGFNSYIVCPRLPTGDWLSHKTSFFSLLDHVVTKYQVDTRKIILMGHSLGGTGVEYFAYQKPAYFSCQIIMSGYNSNVDITSMKDFPTKIFAENDTYTSHYAKLKETYGEEACTVLNCEHGQVPKVALTSDGDNNKISDLLFWALSQTNKYSDQTVQPGAPQEPEQPEQPQITLPITVTVTSNDVNLRKGPSTTESVAESDNKAHAGQQLKIVEIVEAENYHWGKLDADMWKTSKSSSAITKCDRWIALEYTTLFGDKDYKHDDWVKPLTYKRLSSPYGYRTHPIDGTWKMHNGVDLGAYWGTPIFAAKAGTVKRVGNDGSAGNAVYITHDSTWQTDYFHLEEYLVKSGDKVEAGQMIARCGSTGGSTGPHLHFQIRKNGSCVDPEKYIKFR